MFFPELRDGITADDEAADTRGVPEYFVPAARKEVDFGVGGKVQWCCRDVCCCVQGGIPSPFLGSPKESTERMFYAGDVGLGGKNDETPLAWRQGINRFL